MHVATTFIEVLVTLDFNFESVQGISHPETNDGNKFSEKVKIFIDHLWTVIQKASDSK